MANPLQFDKYKLPEHKDCRRCQDLLTDAVDERLDPADQIWFDRHIASCMDCQQALADARRGAAWLSLIKSPRPEPSAQLLTRILAATATTELADFHEAVPHSSQPYRDEWVPATNLIPFRRPTVATPNRVLPHAAPAWWREPRLALTAAMAFFSIALTLNMTGVRLNQLHAADLKPEAIKHTFFQSVASVSRQYESLRVVHTLESRVDTIRTSNEDDYRPTPNTTPRPAPEKPKPAPELPHGISRHQQPSSQPRILPVTTHTQSNQQTGGLA